VNKRVEVRVERDLLGEMQLPAGAYWGIQTMRAREGFSISGLRPHHRLVEATVLIKKAAAFVNLESGRLSGEISQGITQAADEILGGQWRDQFVVDPYQPGCGFAHNANTNEVLANRAAEILGGQVGTYAVVHPADHVNLCQSANDVFPSSMRIAILLELKEMEHVLLDLERLLRRKALEFDRIVKVARPQLRDSVPITLGQEFNAYGSSVERSCRRLREASQSLLELNIGATIVGSGIMTDSAYGGKMIERLSQMTGFRLRAGEDLFRLSQSASDFLEFSASLRELAVELIKISNDLRLLSSGPRTGLFEISLPPAVLEPNPLSPQLLPPTATPGHPECLCMVAYQVIGHDTAVMLAAQSGQLEVNIMTPLIIHNILQSMDILRQALGSFNQHCVAGITANPGRCKEFLDSTEAQMLALATVIGMTRAKALADEAPVTGKTLKQLVLEQDLLPKDQVDKLLTCRQVTQPGTTFDTSSGARF
jgi:aspartate ammonia-lyase